MDDDLHGIYLTRKALLQPWRPLESRLCSSRWQEPCHRASAADDEVALLVKVEAQGPARPQERNALELSTRPRLCAEDCAISVEHEQIPAGPHSHALWETHTNGFRNMTIPYKT